MQASKWIILFAMIVNYEKIWDEKKIKNYK